MTTIHTFRADTGLDTVSIAELSRPEVAALVDEFESSHHVDKRTWRDAFRAHDAAYYRTSALYALLDAA